MQDSTFLDRYCWRRSLPGYWAVSTDKGLPTFKGPQWLCPQLPTIQSFRTLVTMYQSAQTWIIAVYLTQFLSEVSLVPWMPRHRYFPFQVSWRPSCQRCWLQQSSSAWRPRVVSTQQNTKIHFSPCTFCLMTLSVARIILQSVSGRWIKYECVPSLGWEWQRKVEVFGQKTALLPLCPTEILHRPLVLFFYSY